MHASVRSAAARMLALADRLNHRRAPIVIIGLSMLLVVPSVSSRWVLDDVTQALLQRPETGVAGYRSAELDLFVFASGDAEQNYAMIDQGVILPWWASTELKLTFFRPLSALTHRLDSLLYPHSASLMHVHSIGWYAALLAAVALLYRGVAPLGASGGLALWLYAVDDAHGMTVAWLANRNAIIASTFAVLAVHFHMMWRQGARHAIFPSLACLGLGLASAEFAVGAGAYLVAYAAFIERGSRSARLASLAPSAALIIAWRVVYRLMGYGVHDSAAYIDPTGEPVAFLASLPRRIGLLVTGQYGAPPADLGFWASPEDEPFVWALIGANLIALVVMITPRLREDRTVRFWAAGSLLATIPIAASFPSDRVLLLVGVGAMPVLSVVFREALVAAADGSLRLNVRTVVVAGSAALHCGVAPVLLPLRARSIDRLGAQLERIDASLPGGADVRTRSVVALTAPLDMLIGFTHLMREHRGAPRPRTLNWLATASSQVTIRRESTNVLVVTPERGFLFTEPERMWRADPTSLPVGARVELETFTAEVVSVTEDGRPASVRFDFGKALEDPQLMFVAWKGDAFAPSAPLAVGESVQFPAVDAPLLLLGVD